MKSTGFFAEFKKFISRGNVLDMAVGIAAGAAFTAIINSFVNDIINPIIGVLIGGVDFSELTIVLKHATETTPEVAIRYGMFINSIISFINNFDTPACLWFSESTCSIRAFCRHSARRFPSTESS